MFSERVRNARSSRAFRRVVSMRNLPGCRLGAKTDTVAPRKQSGSQEEQVASGRQTVIEGYMAEHVSRLDLTVPRASARLCEPLPLRPRRRYRRMLRDNPVARANSRIPALCFLRTTNSILSSAVSICPPSWGTTLAGGSDSSAEWVSFPLDDSRLG